MAERLKSLNALPPSFLESLGEDCLLAFSRPGRNVFYFVWNQRVAVVGLDSRPERWTVRNGQMTAGENRGFDPDLRLADLRHSVLEDFGIYKADAMPFLWFPRAIFEMKELPAAGQIFCGSVATNAIEHLKTRLAGTAPADETFLRALANRPGTVTGLPTFAAPAEAATAPVEVEVVPFGQVVSVIGPEGTPIDLAGVLKSDGRDIEGTDETRGNPLASDMRRYMADGLRLGGPATEDDMDILAASLFRDAPWQAAAIVSVLRCAKAAIQQGARWFELEPTLLVGPSGGGKSWLARELALRARVPVRNIDAGTATALTPFVGLDGSWRNASPSEVISLMASEGMANPIMIVDGLDRASSLVNPVKALYPFIDPGTARDIYDHFLRAGIDMSYVGWIFIAESASKLPASFVERCNVVTIDRPDVFQLQAYARRRAHEIGLSSEAVEILVRGIGKSASLHRIERALRSARAVTDIPVLH